MNKFLQLILLSVVITIGGCCTKKDCFCMPGPVIRILFNYDATDSRSFPAGSESGFYIIQTSSSYAVMDSSKIILDPTFKSACNYSYSITENRNGKSPSLQGYNFIIVNRSIGFADTLAELAYDKVNRKAECNKCMIGHDYYDCETIENVQFKNKNSSITQQPFLINKN